MDHCALHTLVLAALCAVAQPGCVASGGGHTWPGGGDLRPMFGYKVEDFHASERIIDFFEEHPKPGPARARVQQEG